MFLNLRRKTPPRHNVAGCIFSLWKLATPRGRAPTTQGAHTANVNNARARSHHAGSAHRERAERHVARYLAVPNRASLSARGGVLMLHNRALGVFDPNTIM